MTVAGCWRRLLDRAAPLSGSVTTGSRHGRVRVPVTWVVSSERFSNIKDFDSHYHLPKRRSYPRIDQLTTPFPCPWEHQCKKKKKKRQSCLTCPRQKGACVSKVAASCTKLTSRRVRREELNDWDASSGNGSEEDAEIRARLEEQLAQSLGLVLSSHVDAGLAQSTRDLASQKKHGRGAASSAPAGDEDENVSEETDSSSSAGEEEEEEEEADEDGGKEEYEFRLFGGADATATKVVLEDDSRPMGEGRLENARPRSFYLATMPSEEEKQGFQSATVTAEQVVDMSRQRCWGLELPWKVTHIDPVISTTTTTKESTSHDAGKRKRPGKKSRIATRTRQRADKAEAEVAAKQAGEKEEQVKEKKKRLNRLKKLRKRAKSKGQKTASQGAGEGEEGEEESSEG